MCDGSRVAAAYLEQHSTPEPPAAACSTDLSVTAALHCDKVRWQAVFRSQLSWGEDI